MFKACRNSIVTLEPLEDMINNEKRKDVSDPLHAKFRCDKAKVISIINVKTGEEMDQDESIYDEYFIYKKNKIVSCGNFNSHVNTVCAAGIHYFKTHEAALSWFYRNDITFNNNITFPDGKCVGWHDNGIKEYEKFFKNGKKDGEWREWWYETGRIKCREFYKNGMRNGELIDWYSNGKIKCKVFYKNGHGDGEWREWYETGRIKCIEFYKNKKRNGERVKWYETGKIKCRELYKNGIRDGHWGSILH